MSIREELATNIEQRADRITAVQLALWENRKRREGINPRTGKEFNDPKLVGKLTVTVATLGVLMADAIKRGDEVVVLPCDAWINDPGVGASGGEVPVISGTSRAFDLNAPKEQPDSAAPEAAAG